MKPGDNLNILSEVPRGAPIDSTTDNNSPSSDSDMEVLGSEASDQKRIIQGLKRTIKRNQAKINDLSSKLAIAEIHLVSEKEKNKAKEDLIKSLKLSMDLSVQNKDMQSQLNELQSALDSSNSRNVTTDIKATETDQFKTKIDELNADIEILESKLKNRTDKLDHNTKKYESDLKEKDQKIDELESRIKLFLETNQKYETDLTEKEEHIAKLKSQMETDANKIKEMEEKLSKFTLKAETIQDNSDSLVFLNCTKMPSIQFVTLSGTNSFAAVFEDLPSAGPGWMVVQRRIDGSVPFFRDYENDFYDGFGDLSREFWLGCQKLHELTTSRRHELYIELVDFDNATAFARYDNFVVDSELTTYKLKSLGNYSGNAGDYLREGEGTRFDVLRIDNLYRGWWFLNKCNLNGKYFDQKTELSYRSGGIWWGRWNMGRGQSLKSCKMLIRPKS